MGRQPAKEEDELSALVHDLLNDLGALSTYIHLMWVDTARQLPSKESLLHDLGEVREIVDHATTLGTRLVQYVRRDSTGDGLC